LVILRTDSLKILDCNLYDYDMKRTMSHSPHEDIVVIGIDDKDIKSIGTFPWDRDVYVPLLKKLNGAKAVVFDISFASESKDKNNDKAFADELKNHKNVVIPVSDTLADAISLPQGALLDGKANASFFGAAAAAAFRMPTGLAIDASGALYVTDATNGKIRKLEGGKASTYAGPSITVLMLPLAFSRLWNVGSSSTTSILRLNALVFSRFCDVGSSSSTSIPYFG
jgi:adenylate cyclase